MGDSWYHRSKALAATDTAGDCRSAARRLRTVAEGLDGTVGSIPAMVTSSTWESVRADEWRGELDDAISALDDAGRELERQATILDGTARSWDGNAEWHWTRYRQALADETAADLVGLEGVQ